MDTTRNGWRGILGVSLLLLSPGTACTREKEPPLTGGGPSEDASYEATPPDKGLETDATTRPPAQEQDQ